MDLLRRVPRPRQKPRASKQSDPPGRRRAAQLGLGLASQPAGHVQPRFGRPGGNPWSERKKWVWWDGAEVDGPRRPRLHDDQGPGSPAQPEAIGLDALSGNNPFIMRADGVGRLFVPSGLLDGPLPAHYEPVESPVAEPDVPPAVQPRAQVLEAGRQPTRGSGDPRFPYMMTTYRLTEHYLWAP